MNDLLDRVLTLCKYFQSDIDICTNRFFNLFWHYNHICFYSILLLALIFITPSVQLSYGDDSQRLRIPTFESDVDQSPEKKRVLVPAHPPQVQHSFTIHTIPVLPDAELYLDGKHLGKVPRRLSNVPLGKHRISIQNKHYEGKQLILVNFSLFDVTIVLTARELTGMVFVPGGSFQMGDLYNEGQKQEQPVHNVWVDNFFIGRGEVSFAEYDLFLAARSRKPSLNFWGNSNRPVFYIDWDHAVRYCNWKSRQEGLPPAYHSKTRQLLDFTGQPTKDLAKVKGYRLPTEAEWEYAARSGGRKHRFGNGQDVASSKELNFDASRHNETFTVKGKFRDKTVPITALLANSLGIYNMSGNLWEWCHDWYNAEYYQHSSLKNPIGPEQGVMKVLRGGSYQDFAKHIRASFRHRIHPFYRDIDQGFRIAKTP